MFEIESRTYFGEGKRIGHASIFMNRKRHASKFEVIFYMGMHGEFTILYEENVCLNSSERSDFESWFLHQYIR